MAGPTKKILYRVETYKGVVAVVIELTLKEHRRLADEILRALDRRARKWGGINTRAKTETSETELDETYDNKVYWEWWLDGPQGAKFLVFAGSPDATKEDIKATKQKLRQSRDVVAMYSAPIPLHWENPREVWQEASREMQLKRKESSNGPETN